MKASLWLCLCIVVSWLGSRSVAYNDVDISYRNLQEIPNDTNVFFMAKNFFGPNEEGWPSFESKICSYELNELLGQCVEGATHVRLNVQYYQWREIKVPVAAEDCLAGFCDPFLYTYEKKWSSILIDSSQFHDKSKANPSQYSYHSTELVANKTAKARFASGEEVYIPLEALRESDFAWRPLKGERGSKNNFDALVPSAPFYVDVSSIDKRSNHICYKYDKYGDHDWPFWIEIPASEESKDLVLSSESTDVITEAMKAACSGAPQVGATRIYIDVKAQGAILVRGVSYEKPQDIWSQMKTNAKGLLWSEETGRVIDIAVTQMEAYETSNYLRCRNCFVCRATFLCIFAVLTFVICVAVSRRLKHAPVATATVPPGGSVIYESNTDSDVGLLNQIGGVSSGASGGDEVGAESDIREDSGSRSVSGLLTREISSDADTDREIVSDAPREVHAKVEEGADESYRGAGMESSISRNAMAAERNLRGGRQAGASSNASCIDNNNATAGESSDEVVVVGSRMRPHNMRTSRSPSPSSSVETRRQSPIRNSQPASSSSSSSSANPRRKRSRLRSNRSRKRNMRDSETTPSETLDRDTGESSGESDLEHAPFSRVSSMDQ